jgi:LPS sulfotransferase NodH/glycosyltransferase involved in cell wall biosynthesis/Flp pilus assembly protein TadD
MRISLCIVARNEALFLRACIASARPAVDEVVVVDTGSTDGTPDIAREAGACVVEADWPGDLGAAHNLPLLHATGDWILSLDADEILDPGSRDILRQTVASAKRRFDGFRVAIRNYDYALIDKLRRADPHDPLTWGALTYRLTAPVRVFRAMDAFRFQGRLHQRPAVGTRRHVGRIGVAPLIIHHYGWLRTDRSKTSFYRALARRQVASQPADPRAWMELGVILSSTDLPAAVDAFRCARRLGDRTATAYLIGSALIGLGQPRAALKYLTEAAHRNRRDRSPYFDRADAFELLGAAYDTLAAPRRAEAAYRRALALRPDSPAAQNDLAGLLSEKGAHREAVALLETLLDRFPGLNAPWVTLGIAQLGRGDLDAAQRAFERALDINPRNLNARVNLGLVHTCAGRPHRAARAYTAALELRDGDPADRLGLIDRLPRRSFRSPLRPMARGGVVSVIAHLHGGAGRVLVDAVRALRARQHLVLCGDAGAYNRLELRAELRALDIPVQTVASPEAVRSIITRMRPACVLEHWWDNDFVAGSHREHDDVPWVAFGHASSPMPAGYDAYVLLSEFQSRRQRHLPADRTYMMANGVDHRRFRGSARMVGRVTIAMVSRLECAKFPRRLVDYLPALRKLDSRVLIAGAGGRRFEIEPEISARGLERFVRFVGVIRPSRIPDFLARASIGLHLTETAEEICPLAVLEMLAAGLPIVAEPKGCLPEMIVSGENGFLAESPDEVALHLQRLIEDPGLRRRMGAASRQMARKYSLARFERQIRTLVGAVCNDRRPRSLNRPLSERPTAPSDIVGIKRSTPALEMWRPRRSVFVCGTPRSGSGLMCEALWNTGLAGRAVVPSDFGLCLPRADGPVRSMEAEDIARAIEERASPNGMFAAPFSLQQIENLLHALSLVVGCEHTDAGTLLRGAFADPRFVWVNRRDKLRQAISWARAVQSGVWTTRFHSARFVADRPAYDSGAIRQRLLEIDEQEARWRALFQSVQVVPTVVAYEDLVRNYEGTARRMLASLDISTPRDLVFGERRLVRQADALTDKWAQRFIRSDNPAI